MILYKISHIYKLLHNVNKKKFYFLIFIISLTSILELLSIYFLSNSLVILVNDKSRSIFSYNFVDYFVNKELLLVFALTFIIFSNFFKLVLIRKLYQDVQFFGNKLSYYLLSKKVNQEYEMLLTIEKSKTISDFTEKISILINNIISPFLFATHALTGVIFILIFLFFYLPYFISFALIAIIFSLFIIFFSFKQKLNSLNNSLKFEINNSNSILKDIIENIALYKIENSLHTKLLKFSYSDSIRRNNQGTINFYTLSPKIILEILVIFICLIIILLSYLFKLEISSLLGYFAITIYATYKILPYLQQIYSFVSLSSGNEFIFDLTKNFSVKDPYRINLKENIKINNFDEIYFSKLKYKFNQSNQLEFKDIKIYFNKFNLIKGPSGSGKTTLLNILLKLLENYEGRILLTNNSEILDFKSIDNHLWWNKISFLPQKFELESNSLINVIKGENDINNEKLKKVIKLSCIEHLLREDKNIGSNGSFLSGGEKQRIMIARALYQDKEILILDEPTNGLNKDLEKKVLLNLKSQKNITLIVVTHSHDMVKLADNIIEV